MKFPASVFLTFCLAAGALAQSTSRVPMGDPKLGAYVEVSAVFSSLPPAGYAPVVVQVKNEFDRDLGFRIKANATADAGSSGSHRYASEWTFTGKKRSSSTHSILVPLCTNFERGGGYYSWNRSSLALELAGEASTRIHLQNNLSGSRPVVALSHGLTAGNLAPINAAVAKSSPHGGSENFACEYQAENLPEDWRGYTGLDFVGIRTDEWLKLAPGVRTGILQWVQLGGNLDLFTSSGEPASALQLPSASDGRSGFGNIRIQSWNGKSLNPAWAVTAYADTPALGSTGKLSQFSADKSGMWAGLIAAFGRRSFNAWQVGIVLLVFGVLVGPVNLFHFAKSGKRHRLFFTTPIISLAASGILLLVIFFQDGAGGQGVRSAIVYLNPADSSAFVRQHSMARTGVLFTSSFKVNEASFISPVVLPNSQWTRLKEPGFDGSEQSYSMSEDKSYAGDWFQSRSEQAMVIETVRSTRGRVELESAAGQPPKLRSSLGYPLEKIWYCDAAGQLWASSGPLATGQSVLLQKGNPSDYEKWRKSQPAYTETFTSPLLAAARPPQGHFFASATGANPELIGTLSSIDWNQNHLFLWGPVPQAAP